MLRITIAGIRNLLTLTLSHIFAFIRFFIFLVVLLSTKVDLTTENCDILVYGYFIYSPSFVL